MRLSIAVTALFLCLAGNAFAEAQADNYWPQWRGPLANGVGPHAQPPLTWSETNHIQWKLAVPGEGDSTPIVWADRVFLLSAIPGEGASSEPPKEKGAGQPYRFSVICIDRASGKILWQKVA